MRSCVQFLLDFPVAIETIGPINSRGRDVLVDLDRHISDMTSYRKGTLYFFQRTPVAVNWQFNVENTQLFVRMVY
jgi:hypothetical protein